ncbi:MAG TPA: hypothetical protein VD996_08930 [Chitinophagaceae bacterium]|nr:hypothetical protein [Chitinophagaceae bacterium]
MIALKRFFLQNLPYLYFSLFFIGMYTGNTLTGSDVNIGALALALPFLAQMVLQKRYIDLLLGIATVIMSLWLTLAYISDLMKISVHEFEAWKFIVLGGTVIVLNFVMSFLFFCKAERHVKFAG